MTDDEAFRAAWEDAQGNFEEVAQHMFYSGLAHARAWRDMTEDPSTWPEENQLVALLHVGGDIYGGSRIGDRMHGVGNPWISSHVKFFTKWSPLPAFPEEQQDG